MRLLNKRQGIETEVSRALVRVTVVRMSAIIKQLGCLPEPLVPGYRTKIVDGNHLRIGELRERNVAPLPGGSLVVLA